MRQLIIATLLGFPGLNASAAWELLIEMPEGKIYVDRTTIKRVGGMIAMSSLTDLTFSEKQLTETPPSFRSTKQRDNYDCVGKTMRVQGYVLYSGPMATGTTLMRSDEGTPWAALDPKSQNVLKWRIACSVESR